MGQKASFVIKVTSPFSIVNGTVKGWFYKLAESDSIEIFFSKDSVNWTRKLVVTGTGNLNDSISLYNDIQPLLSGAPTFAYYLKFVLNPSLANTDCGLDSLDIQTTFQVSRFFMPRLKLGANHIEYTDKNNDSTNVLFHFKWQETTSNNPPEKVMNPVFPADGSFIDSLKFNFTWATAVDLDGDTINNYEFELSDYANMKYPLSPVFSVYTNTKPYFSQSYWQKINDPGNKTASGALQDIQIIPTYEVLAGTLKEAVTNALAAVAPPDFLIPENGLLNAGQTYYWRVRARDSKGAWGLWSNVWSFTANGAMPPQGGSSQVNDDSVRLSWNKNSTGAVPSYYEIHSSNEWLGFTPDSSTLFDTAYSENYSFALNSNSVPDIFYRVIAVDANGKKSGVSEVIQLSYPYYLGKVDTVIVDSVYTIALNTASFWFPYYSNSLTPGIATDTIRKTMLHLPSWLTYNSATDTISGIADSLIIRQMLYDTLLSTIIVKMEGKASFPHLSPSYVNVIPSLQNTQIIRLSSSYKNNTPSNFFKDTSFIVGTKFYEQIVNGYDVDTLYGDSVSLQILSKPLWLNEINASSSSIKLSGTPGTSDTGDFIVTIQSCDRLNACAVDTFLLFVRMPQLNILSDSIYLCKDDTLLLFTADEPGYFLQWYKDSLLLNGATDDSLVVTNAGIYKVRMSADSNMYAFSSSLTVVIVDTNVVSILTPLPTPLCNGDTVILKNAYPTTYSSLQWYMNDTLLAANTNVDSLIVTQDGTYHILVLTNNGCQKYSPKDTIQFINIGSPMLIASSDTALLCSGDSVYLIYNNVTNYSTDWYKNDTLLFANSNKDSLLVTANGSYHLLITDTNGCQKQSVKNNINIKINTLPVSILTTLPTPLCDGDTVILKNAYPTTYSSLQWYMNDTLLLAANTNIDSLLVTQDGAYHILIVTNNGCQKYSPKDTIQFINISFPILIASSDTALLCAGDSVYLIYKNLTNYSTDWYKNDTLLFANSNHDSLLVTANGSYHLLITDTNGCQKQSVKNTINSKNTIKPLISINGDTLEINPMGVSYQWFFQGTIIAGANQQTHIAGSNGAYFVEVVLPNGCIVHSDTVVWTQNFVSISGNANTCTAVFNSGNNTLTIFMNNPLTGDVDLKVVTMYGSLVKQINFFKNTTAYSTTINMNDVSTGVYIVSLQNKGNLVIGHWSLVIGH